MGNSHFFTPVSERADRFDDDLEIEAWFTWVPWPITYGVIDYRMPLFLLWLQYLLKLTTN